MAPKYRCSYGAQNTAVHMMPRRPMEVCATPTAQSLGDCYRVQEYHTYCQHLEQHHLPCSTCLTSTRSSCQCHAVVLCCCHAARRCQCHVVILWCCHASRRCQCHVAILCCCHAARRCQCRAVILCCCHAA